jgi:iron complex transport system substrate-binding protein
MKHLRRLASFRRLGLLLLAMMTATVAIACHATPDPRHSHACRSITHVMGETCVPIEPQRVITLGVLGHVLPLDVEPVGAIEWGGEMGQFPDYLQPHTEEIVYLGQGGQPNLERIAQLKPDLILGTEADREIYHHLSQIAPTVLIAGRSTGAWKEQLYQVGVILGKTEQVDRVLAEYQQRVEWLQQQLGTDRLASLVISFVRVDPSQLQIPQQQLFASTIFQDVGLSRPPSQNKDGFYETVSLEKLPEIDGDVILVMAGWQDGDRSNPTQQLADHPLWLQLNAVQQGQVYVVPDYWIAGDIIAAHRVLDDLHQYLLNTKAERS